MITASVDIICAEMKYLISVNRLIKNYQTRIIENANFCGIYMAQYLLCRMLNETSSELDFGRGRGAGCWRFEWRSAAYRHSLCSDDLIRFRSYRC
jgi:D-mannonate dehydratase